MKKSVPKIKFSKKTLEFLAKAGKQKNPDWLDKNMDDYESLVRGPFIELATRVKLALQPLARDYHFPSKGLARIKRPEFKVARGQNLYKDWISMIATRPSASRFESHPQLFFGLFPNEDHHVLVAGGLWQPTSRQIRLIREAISKDSSPFHELFNDKKFKKRFPNGFQTEDVATRTPRGFSDNHEDIEWIRFKRFVVSKIIPIKEFSSEKFSDSVIEDFKQALRLNQLLDSAIKMQWPPK